MKQKHEADPVIWRSGSDSLITGIVALILAIRAGLRNRCAHETVGTHGPV